MAAARISVVIPAYRADATLPRVLAALAPQIDPARHDVWLVRSADGLEASGDVASLRQFADSAWLTLLRSEDRLLPGRARNLGVQASLGELLAFLDADAIPAPNWLAELERALVPPFELVCGSVVNGTPGSSWGTALYMLEFLEWAPQRTGPLEHGVSCNMLVRRAALERAGGFPADLHPGEDTVLSRPFALRGALGFAPAAQVTHLGRTDPREVIRHQWRLGLSWPEVCRRVPIPGDDLASPTLAPLALAGRGWALLEQIRRAKVPSRRAVRLAAPLTLGLLAWGAGVGGAVRRPSGRRTGRR